MTKILKSAPTVIWLLLLALTGLSFLLGEQEAVRSSRWLSSILLAVAFFKVRLVGLHFMELRNAPMALRMALELWVLLVCGALLALYLL